MFSFNKINNLNLSKKINTVFENTIEKKYKDLLNIISHDNIKQIIDNKNIQNDIQQDIFPNKDIIKFDNTDNSIKIFDNVNNELMYFINFMKIKFGIVYTDKDIEKFNWKPGLSNLYIWSDEKIERLKSLIKNENNSDNKDDDDLLSLYNINDEDIKNNQQKEPFDIYKYLILPEFTNIIFSKPIDYVLLKTLNEIKVLEFLQTVKKDKNVIQFISTKEYHGFNNYYYMYIIFRIKMKLNFNNFKNVEIIYPDLDPENGLQFIKNHGTLLYSYPNIYSLNNVYMIMENRVPILSFNLEDNNDNKKNDKIVLNNKKRKKFKKISHKEYPKYSNKLYKKNFEVFKNDQKNNQISNIKDNNKHIKNLEGLYSTKYNDFLLQISNENENKDEDYYFINNQDKYSEIWNPVNNKSDDEIYKFKYYDFQNKCKDIDFHKEKKNIQIPYNLEINNLINNNCSNEIPLKTNLMDNKISLSKGDNNSYRNSYGKESKCYSFKPYYEHRNSILNKSINEFSLFQQEFDNKNDKEPAKPIISELTNEENYRKKIY